MKLLKHRITDVYRIQIIFPMIRSFSFKCLLVFAINFQKNRTKLIRQMFYILY